MAGPKLTRRLNPMDAFFLFGDSEESPMTIGCVALFEGKIPFKKFVDSIDSRLHLIPRYRQVVVPSPFNIGMPTWESYADFDISEHIHEVKLDKPGTEDQLTRFAEEVFEGTLDMERPLWEIFIVRGLQGDHTGLITRVHHAMVDGIAGVGLMTVIFDVTPTPPKIRKKPFKPDPMPDTAELLQDAVWDTAIDGVDHWTNFQKSLAEFGRGRGSGEVISSVKEFGSVFGELFKPSRRMPFNKPFSGGRDFAFGEASFAEMRGIRAACGGTVNDVALAILGGAMTRYVEMHGIDTDGEELQVLCPVNIRMDHEGDSMGNRITFLPVKVPLDVADPVERLKIVTDTTQRLKQSRVPEAVSLLFDFLQGMPPMVQKMALSGLASGPVQGLLDFVPQIPPAHLICTNVPGPQIPLYTMGHRLIRYHPLLPLALEMGISCGITSYDQMLYFSFMGDGACAPDVEMLRNFHGEAFAELRDGASVAKREYVPLGKKIKFSPNGSNGKAKPQPKAAKRALRRPRMTPPPA